MPKSPLTPIHIRVDTQEERFGIPALLDDVPQVHVERIQLQLSDYDVRGDPRSVFERKTGSDFLISLTQGRLFEQLTAPLTSDFAPILLLEGDPLSVSRFQMRPSYGFGALTYISAILHIPILPSGGPSDTASLLFSTAR
jgi:ERCC4-type nuclease